MSVPAAELSRSTETKTTRLDPGATAPVHVAETGVGTDAGTVPPALVYHRPTMPKPGDNAARSSPLVIVGVPSIGVGDAPSHPITTIPVPSVPPTDAGVAPDRETVVETLTSAMSATHPGGTSTRKALRADVQADVDGDAVPALVPNMAASAAVIALSNVTVATGQISFKKSAISAKQAIKDMPRKWTKATFPKIESAFSMSVSP